MKSIKTYFLTVMITTMSVISLAQTKPANPFGLVYGDAITENVQGKVNIHPVTYKLNGIEIAAKRFEFLSGLTGFGVFEIGQRHNAKQDEDL